MTKEDVEKWNMVILLAINLVTLLKNARVLHVLSVAQCNFRVEVRRRLSTLESPDRE